MSVFAVALRGPNEGVWALLREKYTDNFEMSATLFLVRSDNVAEKIAMDVGMKGSDRVDGSSGVVFKLNKSYSGFASNSLWEWLEPDEKGDS